MRTIPDALASRLGGATTLCHCWRLLLRDGSRIGFTDHDLDLSFDGLVHAAASGFDASEVETSLGFASVGGEVAGAFMAASLTEADLASGRFDGATLETWLVDWAQPDARLLLDLNSIGEVSRSDSAFVAEVRSLASAFDDPRGRLYQAACSADLGDARCGVALTASPMRVTCSVIAVESASSLRLATTGTSSGWFSCGSLYHRSQRLGTIREHSETEDGAFVALWERMVTAPQVGDSVVVVAGCDKSLETCRSKFSNQTNFRGFPHMPGNDVILGYVKTGEGGMDGGSFFR